MGQTYIIQFTVKDESVLVDRIKALGRWMTYFPSSIVVESNLSPKEIYDKISVGFEKDRILILQLVQAKYWGVMPKEAWDWLKTP